MKLSANARASIVATIFFLGSMAVAAPIEAQDNYDAVITNGRVMDPESGLDAVRNVGILAGKIRAISTGSLVGKTKIDAKGLVIAPGFIASPRDSLTFTNTARMRKTIGSKQQME